MQLAGLRGLVYDPKVDLSKLVASTADGADTPSLVLTGDGAPKRDASRAVYRYHQVYPGEGRTLTRKLLLAAGKLVPWSDGSMRASEVVSPAARAAELARLRATGVQTQPLLVGYRDAAGEAERRLRGIEGGAPMLEVRTADGTLHRVWRERSAEVIGALRVLFAPKKATLLDGHARYDALLAYSDELAAGGMYAASNYALMALVALDDPTLPTAVRARHRVIRGPVDAAAVLAAAREYFVVEKLPGAGRDAGKLAASLAETLMHQPGFALAFAGDADGYKLTLSPDVSPVAEGVAVHRAVQKLDPIVVEQLFVARVLPAGAQVALELDPAAAIAALGTGASAAVLLRPLPLDQVTHAAELGAALPAGSSAWWPPVAAGLVMHVLDRDEDLV